MNEGCGIRLENLTWPEAEKTLRDYSVVLVPLGARLKEHGHHLPLNNDWIMAEYLGKRVTEKCPVLTLPTLEHGYYPAFTEYPGSVHVRKEIFREYLVDVLTSLAVFIHRPAPGVTRLRRLVKKAKKSSKL